MENETNFTRNKAGNFNCKSPLLFSIPLDVYSDEVEKERDKESFLKIRRLQKKCEQLREKLHSYAEQHLQRIETTRSLVLRTIAFHKNSNGRKVDFYAKIFKGL